MLNFRQIDSFVNIDKNKKRGKLGLIGKSLEDFGDYCEYIANNQFLFERFGLPEDNSFLEKVEKLARSAREEEIDFMSH